MTSNPSADRAPRVSVIMAVHNAERWLAEAIESVLNQSFTDFEFLIHNDGSSDGSLEILQNYMTQDNRIMVSTSDNQGPSAARNTAIDKACGEFLAIMDADDVCLPDRFEKQLAYLDANPDCVVIGGCETTMDEKRRPIFDLRVPLTHEEIDGNNLRGITSIRHPTVMMRRAIVLKCGNYDVSYRAAQDHDLWLRIAEIGHLANLPDILIRYRIHDKSISGAKPELQRQMCRKACEAAWARRGLTGMSFDYSDWRMADTPESQQEFYLRYGWQAWNNGYRDTWRHYALHSVKMAPFSRNAWALLIAGALKRPNSAKTLAT